MQMKETFDRLVGMCAAQDPGDWWCSSSHTFTLMDFVILIISAELSPFGEIIVDPTTGTTAADDPTNQTKLATAAANWFSESCLATPGCKGISPNAILNWLGENFESAQRLFPETSLPTPHPNMTGIATAVTNAVFSVGSSPKSGGTWGLVHWGNASYYKGVYGVVPSAKYKLLDGNAFYVIPYGEENIMTCGNPYRC